MLIGLTPNDEEMALQSILGQKLNVRETENLAKNLKSKTSKLENNKDSTIISLCAISANLQEILKTYNIESTIKKNSIILQCDKKANLILFYRSCNNIVLALNAHFLA